MRVSPVGWAFDSVETVLAAARASAVVTHDHPEGVKGAQATALAVFRARTGVSKEEIRYELSQRFDYDLSRTIEGIRPTYRFDVTCQGSVPEAIIAFLDARSVDHAIRLAISLGGDADTQAAIAGAIAEAYSDGISTELARAVRATLEPPMLEIVDRFHQRFGPKEPSEQTIVGCDPT
jgi:ADP-ribosylglycohydrolase